MEGIGIRVSLILSLLILSCPGCHRRSENGAPPRVEPVTSTAPTWGVQTEGLQCRLRPVKRLWNPNEPILFKLDLRNQGKRVFAVSDPIYPDGVSVDGRWHHRPQPSNVGAKVRALGPGAELAGLSLSLPAATQLPLGPGPHRIQVSFVFEGIQVRSGAAAIEIGSVP